MGMSGLARGRAPWVMKSSFLVPRRVGAAAARRRCRRSSTSPDRSLAGVALFWVWGVGSAALALADTDMPGEAPTRAGAAHALIAMVAYVAGAAGAIVLSLEHPARRGHVRRGHLGAAHLDHRGRRAGGAVRGLRRGRARGARGAPARRARRADCRAASAAARPRRRPPRRRPLAPPPSRRASAARRRPAAACGPRRAALPARRLASCTTSPATPASASASSSGCSWPGRCSSRSACSRPSARPPFFPALKQRLV